MASAADPPAPRRGDYDLPPALVIGAASTPVPRHAPASEMAERLLAGDRLALSRLMSAVEEGRPDARAALRHLFPRTGRAHVVGVTGPPGSGKSTLVSALAAEHRRRGLTVGVVAVDPTSPFSGGAILGDRIRMMDLHQDPGVFVRSVATRGRLGGLSRSTLDFVILLDAFGKELVLVETVGVGQDEVEIATMADTTLVVSVPGLGDDIQAIKAGLLEVADVLVVNKADLPRAHQLLAELRAMLTLGEPHTPDWPPPIRETVATTGQGVAELVDTLAEHRTFLEQSGRWRERRGQTARRQVLGLVEDDVRDRFERLVQGDRWAARFAAIAAREADPYAVADEVLREVATHGDG